jgi:hypothetical protein
MVDAPKSAPPTLPITSSHQKTVNTEEKSLEQIQCLHESRGGLGAEILVLRQCAVDAWMYPEREHAARWRARRLYRAVGFVSGYQKECTGGCGSACWEASPCWSAATD